MNTTNEFTPETVIEFFINNVIIQTDNPKDHINKRLFVNVFTTWFIENIISGFRCVKDTIQCF